MTKFFIQALAIASLITIHTLQSTQAPDSNLTLPLQEYYTKHGYKAHDPQRPAHICSQTIKDTWTYCAHCGGYIEKEFSINIEIQRDWNNKYLTVNGCSRFTNVNQLKEKIVEAMPDGTLKNKFKNLIKNKPELFYIPFRLGCSEKKVELGSMRSSIHKNLLMHYGIVSLVTIQALPIMCRLFPNDPK